MTCARLLLILALASCLNLDALRLLAQSEAAAFTGSVQPVLAKNCQNWQSGHNQRASAGKLDLETLANWIHTRFEFKQASVGPNPGRVTARRLNRTEYNNSIRDLLGVEFRPADGFPQDDSGYGFDNIADGLSVSPILTEMYLKAAEAAVNRALFGVGKVAPTAVLHQPPYRAALDGGDASRLGAAPYTMQDYDLTGLGLPSALHVKHAFPAAGAYEFRISPEGNRPRPSDPFDVVMWIDGKQGHTDQLEAVGFEGQDTVFQLHAPAGEYDIAVSVLRVYEGLPQKYGGPNPTSLPPLAEPKRRAPPAPPADATPEQLVEFEAQTVGSQTRFASIELGCEDRRTVGACDSGYSGAYQNTMSWRTPPSPMPPEVNPRAVFERLFGSEDLSLSKEQRARNFAACKSVLDWVVEDTQRLNQALSAEDRRKIDEYLYSIREVEQRIESAEKDSREFTPSIDKPSGVPVLFSNYLFLGRLKATPEGDGNLLDHSMIVYADAIADGSRHTHTDLPAIVADHGKGALRVGRHTRYKEGTPMTNLWLTLLDRVDVHPETIGDSTGRLKHLTEL